MISTVLGKVALSFGALTMSAGGAAAATGNLPAPAESAFHSVLGAVGVQSDDGADTEEAAPTSTTVVTTTTVAGGSSPTSTTIAASREADADEADADDATKGPDVSPTSPALKGLCTAWSAKPRDAEGRGPGKSDQAVPFAKLAEAAGGATEVEAYCEEALAARSGEDDESKAEDEIDAEAKAAGDATAGTGDGTKNGKANGKANANGKGSANANAEAGRG